MLSFKKNRRIGFQLLFLCSFLFISCKSVYWDLTPLTKAERPESLLYPFQFDKQNPVLYDLGIRTGKRFFSGIFILKKEGTSHFRLAMTSKMGNKIFDMEYREGGFTMHHIIEPMNKKLVINMMQNLFAMMLHEYKVQADAKPYTDTTNDTKVWRWKESGDWQTIRLTENGNVKQYEEGNKRKPSVTIEFKERKNGHPAEILLVNKKWVRFEMLFSQLNR
jgi:hypothetical protein